MKTTVLSGTSAGKLKYERVVEQLTVLVGDGVYRPGDRVPSIREMSRQMGVSVNTVKQAYGLLEDRLILEARPQSGYYVRPRSLDLPRQPEFSPPDLHPTKVSPGKVSAQIMRNVLDPSMVQFGAAIPAPELVPEKKLSRMLATEARRFRNESVAYAMPPGNERLRIQIARRMTGAGCAVSPEDVVITSGACEAVFLALRAVCAPGDTIAVGSPVYFNFLELFRELHLHVIEIPSSPFTGLSITALSQVLETRPVAACVVITNFNNPLGVTLSRDRKEALVDLLAFHQVPLVEDDINGDLSHGESRPWVAKAWDKTGNVLLCSSFSKTIAPGYRVGWILAGRYREAVCHLKMISGIASASPTQLAVAEFLVSGGYEHHLRQIRRVYAKKTAEMAAAIHRSFPVGTRITRPDGGFTLWVEMPERVKSLYLYATARKEGISIAPGSLFSNTEHYQHYIRLNAALWSPETEWAVETLGRLAKKMDAGIGEGKERLCCKISDFTV